MDAPHKEKGRPLRPLPYVCFGMNPQSSCGVEESSGRAFSAPILGGALASVLANQRKAYTTTGPPGKEDRHSDPPSARGLWVCFSCSLSAWPELILKPDRGLRGSLLALPRRDRPYPPDSPSLRTSRPFLVLCFCLHVCSSGAQP